MEVGAAVGLLDLRPRPGPVFLKFSQNLFVVADGVAGQSPLLPQMTEKGDRERIR